MSDRLGGDAFTRKFNIWPWPWGQGHTKCCPVPSTSCDLFSYKVLSCYVEPFRRRYIYKKIHYLTFDLTLGSRSHKCHPVPSTSCDLFTYKSWSCYLLRFRRRYIYKKREKSTHTQMDRQTNGRRTNFDTKLIYPFFLKEKARIKTATVWNSAEENNLS